MKRLLVACEYSGVVRDAFKAYGWDAWSCDLLPTERVGQHIQGDVLEVLNEGWDMMIAHPPCTDLAASGAKHFEAKYQLGYQQESIAFFMKLAYANIPRICIENPVGIMSTEWRKPDQIIQPWQFGHTATKTTCLWLKGLLPLVPTKIVRKGDRKMTISGKSIPEWYNLPPSEDRWKIRSKTFEGIARAMAHQWSDYK